MLPGYYWYRRKLGHGGWGVCLVHGVIVEFFGQTPQRLGNAYLEQFVEFGPKIALPPLDDAPT